MCEDDKPCWQLSQEVIDENRLPTGQNLEDHVNRLLAEQLSAEEIEELRIKGE